MNECKIYKGKSTGRLEENEMIKGAALVVVLILSLGLVSAVDTPIKVKTLDIHKVSIFVLDASQTYYLLESYHKNSDANGLVSVVYSGSKEKVNIRVVVKDNGGKTVLSEKFGPYKIGSPISILATLDKLDGEYKEAVKEVKKEESVEEINKTDVNKTDDVKEEVVNENNDTKTEENEKTDGVLGTLSGFTVSGLTGNAWLVLGLVIGGLILLAGAFFGGMKYGEHRLRGKGKGVVSDRALEKKFYHTEKELKSAQAEINRLKNQGKVKEMEKRIEEERRELEKLKRGY